MLIVKKKVNGIFEEYSQHSQFMDAKLAYERLLGYGELAEDVKVVDESDNEIIVNPPVVEEQVQEEVQPEI